MRSLFYKTEVVEAYPMCFGEYAALEGAEDLGLASETSGYAIEDAEGYVQWFKAEDFEAEYEHAGDADHLEEHQKRLVVERAQLADRYEKLQKVFNKAIYLSLPLPERELFQVQSRVMKAFIQVLDKRLALFLP